jgi:hypothetical protein
MAKVPNKPHEKSTPTPKPPKPGEQKPQPVKK